MIKVTAGQIYVLPDIYSGSQETFEFQIIGLPTAIGTAAAAKRTIKGDPTSLSVSSAIIANDAVSLTVSTSDPGGHYEVELQLTDTQGVPMNRDLSAYIGICVETV